MTASPTKTPFSAASTAAEVMQGIDLAGKRAVVTGGASGIGVETAGALASAGAAVTLAVRRVDAAQNVISGIRASTGNDDVAVAELELTDAGSRARFVDHWHGPLDILVNNAGVMALPQLTLTERGHELQFATNHLGHFALALGLHDALAAAPDGEQDVGCLRLAVGGERLVVAERESEGRRRPPASAGARSS